MILRNFCLFAFFYVINFSLLAQETIEKTFSLADSLRGALRIERTSTDISYYNLDIEFDLENKSIKGSNTIDFEFSGGTEKIQLDLFENMQLERIMHKNKQLEFERIHNAVFIDARSFEISSKNRIVVHYSGSPNRAKFPPWDGGFVWSSDSNNDVWLAVACEGYGASSWWPNKDHLYDEPDSMQMSFTVPSGLECVSNGDLAERIELNDNKTKFTWKVRYSINNYNVTFNIGKYTHFSDEYISKDGETLKLDYYVLPKNLETAKEHFKQVPGVLEAFEHYFGKYPYWKDGYALVETPYLGMEHQSAIAYGNKYMRGYLGGMIPPEMDWDYIIVHETGHEYFGNSVSCSDHAEMWIHESFTTYMEALYVEYHYGYEQVDRYLSFQRDHTNAEPIIGPMDVNYDSWKGSDMYFKGSWILHSLRHVVNNDDLWFKILKGFYQKYQHSIIKSEAFFDYMSDHTELKINLDAFFKQYLYHADIPTLEYTIEETRKGSVLKYRWAADVEGFNMPVEVKIGKDTIRLYPTSEGWQEHPSPLIRISSFEIDQKKFLINVLEKA